MTHDPTNPFQDRGELKRELGKFCEACQAIPRFGYCHLAGCPTSPVHNPVGGKAEPNLIAEIDAAILGLNRLTGAGEDFIWRPAEKARKALIAAREALGGPVSACIHCGGPLETGPRGFIDCPACNPNPARG